MGLNNGYLSRLTLSVFESAHAISSLLMFSYLILTFFFNNRVSVQWWGIRRVRVEQWMWGAEGVSSWGGGQQRRCCHPSYSYETPGATLRSFDGNVLVFNVVLYVQAVIMWKRPLNFVINYVKQTEKCLSINVTHNLSPNKVERFKAVFRSLSIFYQHYSATL